MSGVTQVVHSHQVYLLIGLCVVALLVLLFVPSVVHSSVKQQSVSVGPAESAVSLPAKSTSQPSVLPSSNQAAMQVDQSTTESNSAEQQSRATANVQVNGQTVPLPPNGNGTVHKEITSDDGSKASVDVTVNSSSSSDSSSFNLNVTSNQSSSVDNSG